MLLRLRPALLPHARWARVGLLLLVLFTLLRSVTWASIQPAWLAPDEDYHWLYINYMVEKHTVPELGQPFYTEEIFRGVTVLGQGAYLQAPRTVYKGDPHAALRQLGGTLSQREPAPPPPRAVLHPPGYYLGGVAVDELLWHSVSVTRLTGIRYYSALLGAITVFFAWLLAAQILAREWQQLAAAAVTATQPILAFSASTITNDVGVALALTASLAWLAWMLRGPPQSKQGIGLGLLLAAAVMIKATTLSLVIIIALALALQWRVYPESRRQLWGIVKWTIAVPVVLTGWWYVRLLIITHSVLGQEGSLTSAKGSQGPQLLHVPAAAWAWLAGVYRSYWFDYNAYEVREQDIWFWLPAIAMLILAVGFVLLIRRLAPTLFTVDRPQLRQCALLVLAATVLLLPPWALDTLRGIEGLPHVTEQGRFLLPAYPGLAVIAVLALGELTGRRPRVYAAAVAAFVAGAYVFYWHTWTVWVLERFYGPIGGHWLRALLHASYGKPLFITQDSLAVMILGALLSFAGAYGVTVWAGLRSARRPAPGPRPSAPQRLVA